MLVYLITFMLGYLVLSSFGCIFYKSDLVHYTYSECLGCVNWFFIYTMFIGWWIAAVVAHEYYDSQLESRR